MTKAGERLLAAAGEMLAIAKGERPAAAIWQNGHRYVPAETSSTVPLDWHRTGSEGSVETSVTITGRYLAWVVGEDAFVMPPDGMLLEILPGDIEDARNAAQDHFESTIQSVLAGGRLATREIEELRATVDRLESLRPHWAKGYSSDSIAAQTATSALSTLWDMLGVKNQSAATRRLRELTKAEEE